MDGGDGFDPCECVWSQEFSMRRLLSLLRQSQSHCTDTECFADVNRPSQSDGSSDYYIVMSIMLMIYFFLHYWMYNSRRSRNSTGGDLAKPFLSNDSNGAPPTPPPSNS